MIARRKRDFSVRSPTRKLPFRLRVQYSGRVGPGNFTLGPSQPGELHPGLLTDPDMSLATHPARVTPRKPAGFRQDKEFLRFPVDSTPT